MFKIKFLLLCLFVVSCASVNVEDNVMKQNTSKAGSQPKSKNKKTAPEPEIVPPEIIVAERPIYIPEKEPSRNQSSGIEAVRNSNNSGIIKPSDYSHAAIVYDYNPDWVYEVYAQPLRVCNIRLEPGERVLEPPFISDSERWNVGAGISLENGVSVQHIYVKPVTNGQEASLIINTDRRVYNILLRSFQSIHMPIIRWRYHSGLPANYISTPQIQAQANLSDGANIDSLFTSVDPRFLSFDYRITYGYFRKPKWLPELVFDDGSKTYITFPDQTLQKEMPAVFENRRDILNYRVTGKLIIIDKLIENITVKIGKNEITVTKRRK